MLDVAVIGGGVSGLAAAYELHRRSVPFTLFERAPRVGGVVRTERREGFTIDAGPDSLLVQKPAAIELCRELGLGPELITTLPPRKAFVVRRGRLYPLPAASVLGIPTRIGPLVTNGLLSPGGKLRMALDLTVRQPVETGDESVASFFRRRFGREAVDYIAEPLLAGIHAGDVERLSMGALFPRLVDAERTDGSVIRAFRRLASERARGDRTGGLFRSLPGGIEQLTTALAHHLPDGAVRCCLGATAIEGTGPFRLRLSSGERISAAQLILAVPAYVAGELIAPLDRALGRMCDAIPYTSTATVVLAYRRDAVRHPLQGTGFVVPRVEHGFSITAGTWASSKWPGRAPDGQVLMRGFAGGARDPGALDRSDTELVAAVHRDLAALVGITAEPTLARVYRWPRANPQHEVGHLARVAEMDVRLADLPGLHLAGAAFRGVGIPDCVAAGRSAGAAAAEATSGRRATPSREPRASGL